MRKVVIAGLFLMVGCASVPQEPEDLPTVPPSKLESNTALAVTDGCSAVVVVVTALSFPIWTPVPLIYGIYNHKNWDNNPDDGTKEVIGLFTCFSLAPIYLL